MLLEFGFSQVLVLATVVLTILALADAVVERANQAVSSGTCADPLAAIQQLQHLRSAGALTDAEFEAKKRELLERI